MSEVVRSRHSTKSPQSLKPQQSKGGITYSYITNGAATLTMDSQQHGPLPVTQPEKQGGTCLQPPPPKEDSFPL